MRKIGSAVTIVLGLSLAGCGGRAGPAPAPGPADDETATGGGVMAGSMRGDMSHYESVIEMLRGHAPGLHIVENQDGTIQVRIRGMNQSLQGTGQEPLVVVDGVPSSRPAGEALMALNPQDVSSIEVFKDVASTAVYGTRGANGVILVRMRRR